MKKQTIISIFLMIIATISLCACGNTSGMDKDTEHIIESFFASENTINVVEQLESNYTNYPKLSSEEIKEIIEGDWLEIPVEASSIQDWWSFEFDDGRRYQRYRYFVEDFDIDIQDVGATGENKGNEYVVKDDVLYIEPGYLKKTEISDWNGYEFYKMHDNFYYVKKVSGKMYEYSANNHIYAQLDVEGNLIYENPAWEKYELYSTFK